VATRPRDPGLVLSSWQRPVPGRSSGGDVNQATPPDPSPARYGRRATG